MARTTIDIDARLLREGFQLTGLKTKKELVNYAIQALIRRTKRKGIVNLEGKDQWVGNLSKTRTIRDYRGVLKTRGRVTEFDEMREKAKVQRTLKLRNG